MDAFLNFWANAPILKLIFFIVFIIILMIIGNLAGFQLTLNPLKISFDRKNKKIEEIKKELEEKSNRLEKEKLELESSKKRNDEIFLGIIKSIIDKSVEYGDDVSQERKRIYDCQMDRVESKFKTLRDNIAEEYANKKNNGNMIFVKTILKECFNDIVIKNFSDMCKKDRMHEKQQGDFIEEQRRIFINKDLTKNLRIRLLNFFSVKQTNKSLNLSFIDEGLLKTLEKYDSEIIDKAVECANDCWELSESFWKTSSKRKDELYKSIDESVKIYIGEKEFNELSENNKKWYDKIPTKMDLKAYD